MPATWGFHTKLYGRRRGRALRPGMARLLAVALPERLIVLESSGLIDPGSWFDEPVADVWLEIGFGSGEHLEAQLSAHPGVGLIGCEPYLNGVAHLLSRLAGERSGRVRILPDDARPLIASLTPASLGRVFILFPDPWPKARHHKRRLVSRSTLDGLARAMRPGAELRIATDDVDYLRWILVETLSHPDFFWLAERPSDWRSRPLDWPQTRYEAKAVKAGRPPNYLSFERRRVPGSAHETA
ncbi:MAG: tRNA (guanosine(46)-N7)-methyltransferase TrmB [Alphaproteobacteria bacterium]|nr:tRNA (guanosine(46)-N7)-methyltransferase TrmB [Alphaproteobacteria bacterium]